MLIRFSQKYVLLFFYIFAFCALEAAEQTREKAEVFEQEQNYKEAEEIWLQLLKQEPDNAYYLYKLGRLYSWTGRYEESEKLLTRSLELNPKDADAKLALAYLFLWTKREKKAQELFKKILQDYPDYEAAKQGLKQAEENIEEKESKKTEETTSEKAETLEQEKNYKEAEVIWLQLLKQEPENAYYLYKLGRLYSWTKRYEESEKLLTKSLELDPKDADAQVALAYLFLWTNREQKAEELFKKILQAHPNYEDAEQGLKKVAESIREKEKSKEKEIAKEKEEKKEPEFEKWQTCFMNQAECLEKKKHYDKAIAIWCYLLNHAGETVFPITSPAASLTEVVGLQCYEKQNLREETKKINERLKFFAFKIGQILSWKGDWKQAAVFLTYALSLDNKYDQAWLRLGYVALFSGQYSWARQIFLQLLCTAEKPDPDVVEAFARASQALIDNCTARKAYCIRLHQPKPTFFDFRQYAFVLKWTDPWLKGTVLYAQERETDLITKVRAAQRNTFFGSLAQYFPLNDQSRLFIAGFGGTEREINLVANQDNFSVLEWKYGIGYDRLINPWFTLRTWCDVKEGRDIGEPLFPFGFRRRFEPGGVLIYNNPTCVASVSAIRDSFMVKDFANFTSTFLPRDNYIGEIECRHCNNWIYTGLLGFYKFYHDTPLNRQWEGQGWVTIGYPKYEPCLFIQYRGRVGGFRLTETDYYSYKRQWEYFARAFLIKEIGLNTELELSYHRSWQWSRDLNQPINTAVFVDSLFRITDKAYLELRHLYRPNIHLIFRTEYYTDSTEYTAWLTKGELQLVF